MLFELQFLHWLHLNKREIKQLSTGPGENVESLGILQMYNRKKKLVIGWHNEISILLKILDSVEPCLGPMETHIGYKVPG